MCTLYVLQLESFFPISDVDDAHSLHKTEYNYKIVNIVYYI